MQCSRLMLTGSVRSLSLSLLPRLPDPPPQLEYPPNRLKRGYKLKGYLQALQNGLYNAMWHIRITYTRVA